MSPRLLIGVALSAACLGLGCDGAEARKGFARGHVSARPAAASVPALRLRTASAEPVAAREPAEDPVRTGGIPAAPTPANPVATPKSDAPWCASGTVIGSGRGFCVIN